MHHRPKLEIAIVWLLLILPRLQQISAYPTINQPNQQQNSYVQNIEKNLYQPPQLEETIEEVQKILQQDPTLPRLTRGEIEELYEKVTREEYEKSLEAGDMGRADSMRALMLVLPYNTDNNTEENLQELYTRPPITKVIDSYTPPKPIKFITHDPSYVPKSETVSVGNMAATTYKPLFPMLQTAPSPTTYHPQQPPLMFKMSPSVSQPSALDFRPVTNLPLVYEYGGAAAPTSEQFSQTPKPVQRFSSHYSAKNTEFLKMPSLKRLKATTSTIKPVADVLEGLGIYGQTQSRKRYQIEDYYTAESAPQPVVTSYVPQSLSAKIKPDAYSSFKPLNIGEEIRIKPEVEDYLTRFGIVGGRKRKALKKGNGARVAEEQLGEESEIATAKIPSSLAKSKKSADSELQKLLSNLQELERLQVNPKTVTTTTTRRPTTSATTTTSSTTTPQALITNGAPMLIEAKKPRRRVDPNIDINFGATGNQQTEQGSADQLGKLLANLQELEKLRINPENALKTTAPISRPSTKPIATSPPARAQLLTNRFSELQTQPKQASPTRSDLDELQGILQEIQAIEKVHAQATSTTTNRPIVAKTNNNFRAAVAPNDFDQLRKLLSDDSALERLYNQARGNKVPATTTTTTTTSTTRKPQGPSMQELEELQKYFAELERARAPTTTKGTTSTTTTTTSTTTSTTTTTPPPPTYIQRPAFTNSQDLAQLITANLNPSKSKKSNANDAQLQELINRVQQLERQNSRPIVTEAPSQAYMGFTSRNINNPALDQSNDHRIPSNDFANLQQLYRQVQNTEKSTSLEPYIEISTAATAPKVQYQLEKRTQDFEQRLIDITNDTGTGSSLQNVDPNDFVHLQKLLNKVQELERVRINADGMVQSVTPNPRTKSQREATLSPNLVTAASIRTKSVQNINGAQIVYPEKVKKYDDVEAILMKQPNLDGLKLDLPAYSATTAAPKKLSSTTSASTSSEELRELYNAPINPKKSAAADLDFEQYQQFFSNLEDKERNSYRNMQPPVIHKTVTKEPPRFVATRKPQELPKPNKQQADLEELQKLLNNADELKKLGIELPKDLSEQIEMKLSKTSSTDGGLKSMNLPEAKPTSLASAELLDPPEVEEYLTRYGILNIGSDQSNKKNSKSEEERTNEISTSFYDDEDYNTTKGKSSVFSLTTAKSLTPKEPKTTTESTIEIPIFSATKIIEAAIKRAAQKIGVSTENPDGFRRRSDTDIEDMDTIDGDLMAEFSEMNYQLAMPDVNSRMDENIVDNAKNNSKDAKDTKEEDFKSDLTELQRLISNLQELQRLNLSVSSNLLKEADAKYLESFKKSQSSSNNDTKKNRRQSVEPTAATLGVSSTTGSPTRINLGLSLDDGEDTDDTDVRANTISSTTASTTTTTEESPNGSLADLENSFGPDPNTENPLPAKKKNGFYFLADWNSFLEVGEGDEQVVVRFSPKIGDPRLFLPVSVP